MDKDNKDYEIGYGKPPREHQFKSGHSGNPKGRPKLAKDFKTDLAEELEEVIEVNEFGKKKATTKQRAYIKRVVAGALSGNTTFTRILAQLIAKYGKEAEIEADDELSADDKEIITMFMKRSQNDE